MTSFSLRLVRREQAKPARPLASKRAFSQLYERTHINVYRYALGLTSNPQDAEDITADTFVKAWDARERFTGDDDAALGWLLTIAKRLIIDSARKRKRHPDKVTIDDAVLAAPQPLPEQAAITQEQTRVLWRLLADLPDDQREMLVLRYILGWQVQQIAAHMNKNPNAVSMALKRSLDRLQAIWPLDQSGRNDHA